MQIFHLFTFESAIYCGYQNNIYYAIKRLTKINKPFEKKKILF
jgi:hypothetical protein